MVGRRRGGREDPGLASAGIGGGGGSGEVEEEIGAFFAGGVGLAVAGHAGAGGWWGARGRGAEVGGAHLERVGGEIVVFVIRTAVEGWGVGDG